MRQTIQMGTYDLREHRDAPWDLLPEHAAAVHRMTEMLVAAVRAGETTNTGAVICRPIRSPDIHGRDGKVEIKLPRPVVDGSRAARLIGIACMLAGIGSARIVCRGRRVHVYHDRPRSSCTPDEYLVDIDPQETRGGVGRSLGLSNVT